MKSFHSSQIIWILLSRKQIKHWWLRDPTEQNVELNARKQLPLSFKLLVSVNDWCSSWCLKFKSLLYVKFTVWRINSPQRGDHLFSPFQKSSSPKSNFPRDFWNGGKWMITPKRYDIRFGFLHHGPCCFFHTTTPIISIKSPATPPIMPIIIVGRGSSSCTGGPVLLAANFLKWLIIWNNADNSSLHFKFYDQNCKKRVEASRTQKTKQIFPVIRKVSGEGANDTLFYPQSRLTTV